MRCYALGGLCVAVVALAAWGAAPEGSALRRGEVQGVDWSPRVQWPVDRGRHVLDAIPTEERRLDERIAIEHLTQRTSADEPVEGLANVGMEAPITFYACYGPNGGFCNGASGPLPLAEGQAACGGAWSMGAVLVIVGDPLGPVVCNDRGWLAPHQVDRFFWREEDGWAWLRQVGGYTRVEHKR